MTRLRGFRVCRSPGRGFPGLRHPQPPGSDELLGAQRRIEFGITVRQPRAAFIREFLVMKSRVSKKSETLEDGAIVELLRVTDQQLAISRLAPEIVTQAIRHVIDAAPHLRC